MFMPFGLRLVSGLTDHGEEYSAWGWAVNGFFSVIGSVLTTILSMTFGFRSVQMAALAIYVVAVLAFLRLRRTAARSAGSPDEGPAAVGVRVHPDGEEAVPVTHAPTIM
jgi:predicted MFS family arabinose efflux permease